MAMMRITMLRYLQESGRLEIFRLPESIYRPTTITEELVQELWLILRLKREEMKYSLGRNFERGLESKYLKLSLDRFHMTL